MKKLRGYSVLIVGALVFSLVIGLGGRLGVFAAGPTTVDLKTTAPFAVLAGTGITDVPTSTITGNVGLSPTTGAAITGLTCAEVTGTIYDVDGTYPGACEVTNASLLTTAKNDLVTAYNDAAGRTPVTTVPTELGGTTKTAGVYDSASTTFEITAGAGPLVLDGQDDSSSVFIFKMASGATGLTVGPGSTVSLINGAQACNVFWQLNTAAIDTTATFKGTILALTSITVANGANIEGRLLARNGNVTLNSNTITVPTCTVASTDTPTTTPSPSTTDSPTTTTTTTPELPDTGSGSGRNIMWWYVIPAAVVVALAGYYLLRRKRLAASNIEKNQTG